MDKKVAVYLGPYCPFCKAAKRLLEDKGIAYEAIDVSESPEKLEEMSRLSGRRMIPQIFIEGKPIGGFNELRALELTGELYRMLGIRSF